MRHLALSAAAALLLVGSLATAAVAATPQPVTITSPMTVNFPDPNTGTFTATGGGICASGTVFDDRLLINGWRAMTGRQQILVVKTFTCADGSGTFVITVQVHTNTDGTEWFTWVIQGGTGDYARLAGTGHGTTVPATGGVVNTYEGFTVR